MSIISIKDTFYLRLLVEGAELETNDTSFDKISVIEAVSEVAPTLQLSIFDNTGNFSRSKALVEGTKFHIEFSKGIDKPHYQGDFRLFGMRNHEGPFSGQMWDLVFLLDVPLYALQSCSEAYTKGKEPIFSYEAMQMLAGKAGLSYEGVTNTDDKQRWLCVAQTRARMAEYIASVGYISDSSCMLHCCTSDKKLLYWDIIERSKMAPVANFLHNTPKEDAIATPHLVRETKSVSLSGFFNSWLNYGATSTSHSLGGISGDISDMNAAKTGPYLPINSDVKGNVKVARMDYFNRLDPGSSHSDENANNIHPNYHKSYYQNTRYKSMFTERLNILTEEQTAINLLDPVEYTQRDLIRGKYEINPRTSGRYIVTGKTRHGKAGSNYYEKFELMRSHITQRGLTNLV